MLTYVVDIESSEGTRTVLQDATNPEEAHKNVLFDELNQDEEIAEIREQRTDKRVYSLGSGFN